MFLGCDSHHCLGNFVAFSWNLWNGNLRAPVCQVTIIRDDIPDFPRTVSLLVIDKMHHLATIPLNDYWHRREFLYKFQSYEKSHRFCLLWVAGVKIHCFSLNEQSYRITNNGCICTWWTGCPIHVYFLRSLLEGMTNDGSGGVPEHYFPTRWMNLLLRCILRLIEMFFLKYFKP